MATGLDNKRRIHFLRRKRAEHIVQLEGVRTKIALADERRKTDRGEERKWNRILDQLEDSMDQIKSVIAACSGELGLLESHTNIPDVEIPEVVPEPREARKPATPTLPRKVAAPAESRSSSPPSSPAAVERKEEKAKQLLKQAEGGDAAKLRSALEKCYSARAHDVSLVEAGALLDEFEALETRADLSGVEAKRLDAIRSVLPVIADQLQAWQIRWSRIRK